MKVKEFFKKEYKNILLNIGIFILISMFIFPIILDRGIGDLDELWNYNFARNVADGLIPYKDFNMVQTPLLPLIAGLILKIFSNELITMRILAILLHTSIIFIMFKILSKLNISKKIITLFLLIWVNIVKNYMCIDYNFATLFITLIIIYIEISEKKEDVLKFKFKRDILLGILSGLTILLKQTTGLIICIVTLFYKVIFIRNKKDLKEFSKSLITKILFILVPVNVLLIYLGLNGALVDFIDYTILGIKTFSNKIPYSNLINSDKFIINALSILIPLTLVLSYIYSIIKKKEKINTIISYSIGMFAVIFPISDEIHFLIGSTIGMIAIVYILSKVYSIIKNKYKNTIKLKKCVTFLNIFINTFIELLLIVYIGTSLINNLIYFSKYIKDAKQYTELEHYRYIKMPDEQINMIQHVQTYIILNEDNNVYILDSDAALFMIPLNKYNKDFDMFLKGNLGSKAEEGQIQKIQYMENNTKILIKNDKYRRNWQNPNKVTDYIKENLEKIGEIEYFDIYIK